MTMLDRTAILSAPDLKTEDLNVPEWGGVVRISMLTGAARDALAASMVTAGGTPDLTAYRAKLVAAAVVDETGARLFSDADVAALTQKSAQALDRVFAVADKLNQLGGQAVEAAEKN